MTTYKKQLHDKDGNTIYPDVGIDLDNVVYSDDPTEPVPSPTAWVGTDEIEDNAVTNDKIDKSTLENEQYIGRASSNGSITLPAGYDIWHIRGLVDYSTCSSNTSMQLAMTNYTGTQWIRRIIWEDDTPTAAEFSYTTGRLAIFGTGGRLATTSGNVAIDLTVLRRGGQVRAFCQFHQCGVRSSGMSDMEGALSSSSSPIQLSFVSTGRTFSNANLIVTGVKSA